MNIKDLDPSQYKVIRPATTPSAPVTKPGMLNVNSKDVRDQMVKDKQVVPSPHGNFLKDVGNLLTSSEQTLGKGLSTVGSNIPQQQADQVAQNTQNVSQLLKIYHSTTDPVQKEHLANALKAMGTDVTAGDINPGFDLTNKQVIGAAAGTALDIASAGSYGKEASLAENSGKLVTKSEAVAKLGEQAGLDVVKTAPKIAPKVAETTKPLAETLTNIAKNSGKTAVKSAGVGYGYDVSQNLQSNKSGADILKPGAGTFTGAALPLAIGALEAGAAVTKELAPRIVNSLVKPSQANFAYGKNPGRTVSELGITGNNLKDFGQNVTTARQEIGRQLGAIYASPENSTKIINAESDVQKIDNAIATAAKGGKNNQGIVTTLQNMKDALLYDHKVTADGDIIRVGDTPRDLSALNPQQAFQLKQDVASMTRFTGNASDDKAVNATLKNIYGGLKEKLNTTVGETNPEVEKLNQQYADLKSAELAIEHRDAIVGRSNLINPLAAVEGTGGAIAGLMSGGPVGAAIGGLSGVALNKALGSTAVKTRVAAWLGSASPSVISKLSPEIKTVLIRALPKLASKIGK